MTEHLKSALIRNFESWEEADVSFHPGVNAIVGDSDAGKSGMLRALEWGCYNQPSGDDCRSDWGGSTEVHFEFADGQLSRIRNNKENVFVLGADDRHLAGRSVPDPVAEFLRMNELNLLSQLDPLFMVHWSSGQRGEFLNRICNFRKIDSSQRSINKVITTNTHMLSELKTLLEEQEAHRERFDDIEDIEKELIKIEQLESSIRKLTAQRKELSEISHSLHHSKTVRLPHIEAIIALKQQFTPLQEMSERIESAGDDRDDLEDIIESISLKEREVEEYNKSIMQLRNQLDKLIGDNCPLCGGEISDERRQEILSR